MHLAPYFITAFWEETIKSEANIKILCNMLTYCLSKYVKVIRQIYDHIKKGASLCCQAPLCYLFYDRIILLEIYGETHYTIKCVGFLWVHPIH